MTGSKTPHFLGGDTSSNAFFSIVIVMFVFFLWGVLESLIDAEQLSTLLVSS